MKTLAISSFFVLFAIVSIATMPSAFADHTALDIEPIAGSGTPGCEETPEGCWTVMEAVMDIGGEVTWINTDSQPHTATNGADLTSPDVGLLFDSGLLMNGDSFSFVFDTPGEYPYFCMVHPWMTGLVIVEAEGAEDGAELMVSIETSEGKAGETVEITVTFNDMEGNDVEHVNYNIMATQGSDTVLDDTGVHDHDGMMTHTTMALPMDASDEMPVDVSVEFLGFGIDPPFTGPIGHVETAQVVPEFGTIAMMVLGISLVSIIALTAKSKVIPRL
jgi:predicted secreted protein with PEFG-CTERM motif